MKIAIIGSRDLKNYDYFLDKLKEALEKYSIKPSLIISGGAKGVDTHAKRYANDNNIELKEFLPDYTKYYFKEAPLKRNDQIIDEADCILAFWNGSSKGTQYVINRSRNLEKDCIIIYL